METRPNLIKELLQEHEKSKTLYDKFEAWAETRDIDYVAGFLVLTGTVAVTTGMVGYYDFSNSPPPDGSVVLGQILFWISLLAFVAGVIVLTLVLNERDAQRRRKQQRKDEEIIELKRKLEECEARHQNESDDLTMPARGARPVWP